MTRQVRSGVRRVRTVAIFLLAAFAALAGSQLFRGAPAGAALYVPLPVYSIDAVSGSHHASLLNLPVGQPGVLAVPMPVDVNGDLLPDVAVSVGLVDVGGVSNPPSAAILSPNIRIDRLLTAVLLGQPSPPLRITANLAVVDIESDEPDLAFRFGYDTGVGGSIPGNLVAVLDGLADGFDPLAATVDTRGLVRGIDPSVTHYQGPLTLLAGFDRGTETNDVELDYEPFPGAVRVSYGSGPAGDRITYAHGSDDLFANGFVPEVDLTTRVTAEDDESATTLSAHIDRLPRQATLDIGSSAFDLESRSDGRRPDLEVDLRQVEADGELLDVRAEIDGVPDELHGSWALPDDGPGRLRFESPDGIGAIEARVTDSDDTGAIEPFVPTERQYVAFQELDRGEGAPTSARLITGRVEGISLASFTEVERGFDASFASASGGLPLELHASLDGRDGGDGKVIEAASTIRPLPDTIDVHVRTAGDDEAAEPLTITYDASSSVDVTADLEFHDDEAAADAECGDFDTICASLEARQVPAHIETRVAKAEVDGRQEVHVDVDATDPGAVPTDIIADVVAGPTDDDDAGRPIVAHLDALAIPDEMRARIVEGADESVEEAELTSSAPIGLLQFAVRNFTEADRPDDLAPPLPIAENGATVNARGRGDDVVDFEAIGRLQDVGGFRFVNRDAFGLHAEVGGGGDLVADVDLRGIEDDDPATGPIDIVADALVQPVPTSLDVCFRGDGLEPGSGGDDADDALLGPCVVAQPFPGRTVSASPLTVSYRASEPVDRLAADLDLLTRGTEPVDDERTRAHLDVADVPTRLLAHVLTPNDADDDGVDDDPLVVHADTGEQPPPTELEFAFESLDADLECRDPRTPQPDTEALCLAASLAPVPGDLDLTYDPAAPVDNLVVETDRVLDLEGFELSQVKGGTPAEGETVGTPEVLLVEGDILGIPSELRATIQSTDVPEDAPGGAESPLGVAFRADPPIALVDATVRTYLGPDPFPAQAPTQRAGLPPVTADFDTVTVRQAGDALLADIRATEVEGAGYRTGVDEDGFRFPAHAVDLRLGAGSDVRAYIDTDDGTDRLLADVTAVDLPAELTACFRGELPEDAAIEPDPDAPTFCETAPGDKALFELGGDGTTTGSARPDVHAYFRSAKDAGTDVLSGRVDVVDLPPLLRGTIGDGADGDGTVGDDTTAVVEALGAGAAGPDQVGRIEAHVATFDIADHGYPLAELTFSPVLPGPAPFPLTVVGGQQVAVASARGLFEAIAVLGPEGSDAGSSFRRLSLTNEPCAAPSGDPGDYPAYPDDPSIPVTYTCAALDVEPTGGADPLAISFVKEEDGTRVALRDAGISDVPDDIQLTLSDTPGLVPVSTDPNEPLRPRCGTVADPDGNGDGESDACLPPMLRFDADSAADAVLWGQLEIGSVEGIAVLAGLEHSLTVPDLDLDASPTIDGWTDGSAPFGLRAKLQTISEDGVDETVGRVGVRLRLPDSVTFEHLQSWDTEVESPATPDEPARVGDAKDLAFGYVVRRDGIVEPDLGRLAILHVNGQGDELVLSDVQGAGLKDNRDGEYEDRPASGIPGELDLAFNSRTNALTGSLFVQADGRVSQPTDLRLQLQEAPKPPDPDEDPFELPNLLNEKPPHPLLVDAGILNLPGPGAGESPIDGDTFRLRAEIFRPDEPEPGQPPGEPDSCPGILSVDQCTRTNIELADIEALIDFQPTGPDGQVGEPARQVRLVAQADGSVNGFHLQAFDEVEADPAATPDAVVTVQGAVLLDPFNISYDGEFIIFNAETRIDSRFRPILLLDRVSDFRLRATAANITTENVDHGLGEGQAALVPLMFIEDFDVDLGLDLGLFELDILGIDWVNPADIVGFEGVDLVAMDYEDCSTSTQFFGEIISGLLDAAFYVVDDALLEIFGFTGVGVSGVAIPPRPAGDPISFLTVPKAEDDPRFVLSALNIPLLPDIGGAIMNIADGMLLCEEAPSTPLIGPNNPGDGFAVPGHPVQAAPPSVDIDEPVDEEPGGGGEPLTIGAGEDVPVCGGSRFSELRVAGTLTVPPLCPTVLVADSIVVAGSGRIVANADLTITTETLTVEPNAAIDMVDGNLDVVANGVVTIDGTIDATGNSDAVPIDPATEAPFPSQPLGGGGAGHGGTGGADALFAPGGDPYGDHVGNPIVEAGAPGGGPRGAQGGGTIVVRGDEVHVTGVLSANGADVAGAASCATFGGPSGGGSGGAVAVFGGIVTLDAGNALQANGGAGGPGNVAGIGGIGGGGGAGGVLKVRAGVLTAPPLTTPSGGAGHRDCDTSAPEDDGHDGGLGISVAISDGASAVNDLDRYWHTTGETGRVNMTVTASVPPRGSADDFTLFMCALQVGLGGGTVPDERHWNARMPNLAGDALSPCGYRFQFGSPLPVGGQRGTPITFTNQTTLNASNGGQRQVPLTEGHWALWTVIGTSSVDGKTCLTVADACRYELAPVVPDVVLGVDSTDPKVEEILIGGGRTVGQTSGEYHTGSRDITVRTAGSDQTNRSGLQDIRCIEQDDSTGEAVRFPCLNTPEAQPYRLQTPTDGEKRITVFATDLAGNTTFLSTTLFLDQRAPASGFVEFDPPDGSNGFHRTAPDFRLRNGVDEPNGDGSAGSGPADLAWRYHVDGSEERSCEFPSSCEIEDQIPDFGRHVVRFTAVDRVGNRRFDDSDPRTPSPLLESAPVLVDARPPTSALLTSPAEPNGENGWFTSDPWVVLAAVDQIGGSGMVAPPGGADPDVPGIYYRIVGDPAGEQRYTTPFRLGPGQTEVCWHAVDAAGAAEAEQCATHVVDLDDPTVTLAADPAGPDGLGGWYRQRPTVEAEAADDPSGAGVVPGTLVVSFDGGPLFTPTGPLTVPEGVHDVRAAVADGSGRRSAVAFDDFAVDLSAPVASHRVLPPEPAAGGWWRRTPRVVLSASDGEANAGIDRIEYRLGAGPFVTYREPIAIPAGTTTLTYRAIDRAGRIGADRTLTFPVDVTPPTVQALAPAPMIWSRTLALLGLGPSHAKLQYAVSDTQSSTLRVLVIVHDALGHAVRRIDAGPVAVTPGVTRVGHVLWDGTDQSLLGFLGIGLYHYRVIVVDEAGNWAESGESRPLQIKLL